MKKASNKLVDLSGSFAVEILNLVQYLKNQHETTICNQIGRINKDTHLSLSVAVRICPYVMHNAFLTFHDMKLF